MNDDITTLKSETPTEAVLDMRGPTGLRAILRREHSTFVVTVECMSGAKLEHYFNFGTSRGKARRFATEYVCGQF